MNQKTIQKNIDNAVRIFKEALENTYLKENKPFYGIGYQGLMSALRGKIQHNRLSNGNLKIVGELPNYMLKDKVKGLPREFDDWDIYPLVVFLFNKEDKGDK